MQDTELLQLWKAQDAKLEKSLAINRQLLRETLHLKAERALAPLKRLKTGGIVAFSLYILLLAYLLVYALSHYSSAWNYFIISIGAIAFFNIKGLTDYARHLYWAQHIDYDGSVMEIQQQLSRIQLSIIRHAKLMCLQFPFYTTFYLSDSWFPSEVNGAYICIQVLVTGAFAYLSYWLYRQHKVENLSKPWFRKLIAGSGGKPVAQAIRLYEQMEDIKD